MFLVDDSVVLSASDLKAAVECEWATRRRLDAKLRRVEAVPDPEDPLNRRAAGLGDEHEARQRDAYLATFGPHEPGRAGGVAVIEVADRRDPVELRAAQRATLAAIADGADVVFQATLFSGTFLGFADFLLRSPEGWIVADTKLARRAKVSALLQLAAYATELRRLGVVVAQKAQLLLGDGTTSKHRLADVLPVFDTRMRRLRALADERLAATSAIEWGAEGVRACGRCAECTAQIEATRDVLLVGRLAVRQRDRLDAVGIDTIDAFARSTGPVPGIGAGPLDRLRSQARLQLAAEAAGDGRVIAEVVDAQGLAALPRPDRGDVFFDFEGDPLWTDDDRVWGIDYLFGVVDHDGNREHFAPFWAHDRAAEKQALLDFLKYIHERRRRHPGMHVYHYADYERSHLQLLSARYGVGEALLDELLREHVLVDLYPIVLRSVRTSQRSYSLKKLEPLYMGDRLRESDVTTGAGSVDAYVEFCRLRDAGRLAEAAAQLAEIAHYNRYDCVSTLGLRDWLLALARDAGVPPRPPVPGEPDADGATGRAEDELAGRLLDLIADVPRAARTADQQAIAMAAAAIEYHRREGKSFWWEHYGREITPVDDWADTRNVLVVEQAEVLEDWRRVGRALSDQRRLRLTGTLATGSTLDVGDTVFLMYAEPIPEGCAPVPAGQRGEQEQQDAIVSIEVLPDGRAAVVLEEKAGGDPWPQLPMALTPHGPLRTAAQRSAIRQWGEALLADPARRDAVLDLVRRTPPRTTDGGPIASPAEPTARAIVRDLLRLDGSYLAVQGPPGSGKTHVGAAVIAELVRDHGWRIGVVAQSHSVVENLLDRVVAAGLDPSRVAKRINRRSGQLGDWTLIEPDRPAGFRRWTGQRHDVGYVVGGTGWNFADRNQIEHGELDLLVIDEAGQYSLANTVAVGGSARSLLLLGDPQQLPQVTQGLHPEPVDMSALGWLSGGLDVLPPEFGVFLPESWRMHPALTAAVSALSYDGRLRARVPRTTDRVLAGVAPGLHPLPLRHSGDTVQSEVEADAVVDLVRSHLGLAWTDPTRNREAEPLTEADVIVVAPFNAQVALVCARLAAAGFRGVRVGTVDKFQGQEAVVSIVTLTASSPADVPRGIGFVLSRNRLNVAISRAQWASYLLHSPALADHLPADAVGVADLSGFLRLTAWPASV